MNATPTRAPGSTGERADQTTEENTAAGIYGVVVGAAVIAASHAGSAVIMATSVVIVLVIYWTAERYSRLLAERIHAGHPPSWRQVRRHLTTGWRMVTASGLPLVVLLAVRLSGAGLDIASLCALATSTALLCRAGWAAGRGGRLTVAERLGSATVTGLFGFAFIALKAALH